MNTIDRGYVLITRGIFDHPMFANDSDRLVAWLWLIARASWKDEFQTVGGATIQLARGELIASQRYLAKAWRWDVTEAGGHKRVARFIDALRRENMISLRIDGGISIVSIVNFDRYQAPKYPGQQRGSDGAATGAATGAGHIDGNASAQGLFEIEETDAGAATGAPSGGHPAANRGKEKTINHSKKNTYGQSGATKATKSNPLAWPVDAFEQWYSIYPKKVSKDAARRAFQKRQASGELAFDDLLDGTTQFAEAVRTWPAERRQFIPHPSTWLNDGRFADEPEPQSRQSYGSVAVPSRAARDFSDDDWTKRLAMRDRGDPWPAQYWGPEPGTPGCLVPAHLLIQPVGGANG